MQTLQPVSFSPNASGGGIYKSGPLIVTNSTISGNSAEYVPGEPLLLARQVFYNDSSFDGNDPLANAADAAAIAVDKTPLRPGQSATLANYTSYDKGINGIMVDIAELPVESLTAADFGFMVGNSGDLANSAAPEPLSIDVLPGMGIGGVDRVTIIWPDGAIRNQWLQIVVRATETRALPDDDVFYFGNAVGEWGNATGNTIVNATDEIMARNFQHGPLNLAAIDDPCDYNRDGLVNGTDQIIARNNQTNPLTMLRLITAPTVMNELIQNGGFETGNFAGWTVTSDGPPQMHDWTVGPAGGGFFFDSSPHAGTYDAYNGFAGPEGQQYTLAQDVTIPAGISSATLVTNHRIRYGAGNEPLQDPVFRIEVCDPAGQWTDVLYEKQIQVTPAGLDIGWLRREFDLSAYAGQTVRIRFTEMIPESYNGPAMLELDDISLTYLAAKSYIIHRRSYADTLEDDVGGIDATLARSSIAFLPDSTNATSMVEYAANIPRFGTLKEASPSDGLILTNEAIVGGGADSMEVWISVGGYVYAIGTTTDDIYRSATGEAPWTRMQTGTFYLLAKMPDDSILVINNSAPQMVFRSTDGCATLVRSKLSGVDMAATRGTTIEYWGPHVASNGTVIMAEYTYAAAAESVSAYRSVDSGANWTKVLTKDTKGNGQEITHFHAQDIMQQRVNGYCRMAMATIKHFGNLRTMV